jgi:hypothetical protein
MLSTGTVIINIHRKVGARPDYNVFHNLLCISFPIRKRDPACVSSSGEVIFR